MDCSRRVPRSSVLPRLRGPPACPTKQPRQSSAPWASFRPRTIHRTSRQIRPPTPRPHPASAQSAAVIDRGAIARGATSAGNLQLIVDRFHLPIRAQQVAGPKSVLYGIVAPAAEKVRTDVPFCLVAITHEPMVSAVV